MNMMKLGLFALTILLSQLSVAETMDVKLHYVGPTEGSAWLGVQQGLDEANIQGEFLGQKYSVVSVTLDELKTLESVTAVILTLLKMLVLLVLLLLPMRVVMLLMVLLFGPMKVQ